MKWVKICGRAFDLEPIRSKNNNISENCHMKLSFSNSKLLIHIDEAEHLVIIIHADDTFIIGMLGNDNIFIIGMLGNDNKTI